MIKTRNFDFIYAIILGITLTGCSQEDMIGPDVNDIYGQLKVTDSITADNDTVNFAQGETVSFQAKFEKDAIWKLIATSKNNGAIWTAEGAGNEINDANSLWNGESDDLPWFPSGLVDVIVTFPHHDDTLATTVFIESPKNHDKGAVLIADFSVAPVSPIMSETGWPSEWPTTSIFYSNYPQPDGTRYLFMEGNAWQGFPWGPTTFNLEPPFSPFVDILRMDANKMQNGYGETLPLYADPSRVYFNIMVYNTGTKYTRLQVKLYESNDQTRILDITPTWEGWEMVTVKYNEFEGTTTPNPSTVWRVEFLLFSDAPAAILNDQSNTVSTAFDHPIFTFDKPLN